MQHLVLGVVSLVVLGALAGVLSLLLARGRRGPAPSTAVVVGVALAFAGAFGGYVAGPKGAGGAFLTGPAWGGALAGSALAVVLLVLVLSRRRPRA